MTSDTTSRPGLIRSLAHRLAGEQLALPVEGRLAPFSGATGWLNSEPLTPEGLRGRVVLVDFWTYTCVNWLRTLPYVRAWAAKYADAGLTVVGVHTPEFGFERDVDNITAAVARLRRRVPGRDRQRLRRLAGLREPLLAGGRTSPTREGRIRYHHFGEGEYAAIEMVDPAAPDGRGRERRRPGPGHGRAEGTRGGRRLADAPVARDVRRVRPGHGLRPGGRARFDEPQTYSAPRGCRSTSGHCRATGPSAGTPAVSNEPGGRIAFRFHARDVNLVMGPATRGATVPFRVFLDGQPAGDAPGTDVDADGGGTRRRPADLPADPPAGRDHRTHRSRSSSSTPASRRTASRSAEPDRGTRPATRILR